VTMEIAPKVRVKISRGAIAGVLKRGEPGTESTSS
jgi:hypothetical protein